MCSSGDSSCWWRTQYQPTMTDQSDPLCSVCEIRISNEIKVTRLGVYCFLFWLFITISSTSIFISTSKYRILVLCIVGTLCQTFELDILSRDIFEWQLTCWQSQFYENFSFQRGWRGDGEWIIYLFVEQGARVWNVVSQLWFHRFWKMLLPSRSMTECV